jgi:hypothetical protein
MARKTNETVSAYKETHVNVHTIRCDSARRNNASVLLSQCNAIISIVYLMRRRPVNITHRRIYSGLTNSIYHSACCSNLAVLSRELTKNAGRIRDAPCRATSGCQFSQISIEWRIVGTCGQLRFTVLI